jgi:uncharacterized protein
MNPLRPILIAIALSLAIVAPASGQDFQQGLEAHRRGDYDTALHEFRPLAEQGNALAQRFLGRLYELGNGVPKNGTEALRWYRLAAEQGDAFAQYSLGKIFGKGQLVRQDDTEAVRWYRLAAEQGLAVAQSNLGLSYELGRGVRQNDTEAVRWYRLAGEQGLSVAQYNLGLMYELGQGVTRDYVEAARWYRLAAEQGDLESALALSSLYNGRKGPPQDDVESLRWLRFAADDLSDASSQYGLSLQFLLGSGVPVDNAEAIHWMRLAAEQGYVDAQTMLGEWFGGGMGVVTENLVSAYMWSDLAAAQGDVKADTNRYLYARKMTREQIAEAQRQSTRCKASGYKDCGFGPTVTATPARIDKIIREDAFGSFNREDYEPALRDFKILAEKGDPEGQLWIGYMYYYGLGVNKDNALASYWWRKSVQSNNFHAKFFLGRLILDSTSSYLDEDKKNFSFGNREEAKDFILEAARSGGVGAQQFAGLSYQRKLGISEENIDYKKAAYWFHEAAKNGSTRSKYELGGMFLFGDGVQKNIFTAYAWTYLASLDGYDDAKLELNSMAKKMTSDQINEAVRIANECRNSKFQTCPGSNAISPVPNGVEISDVPPKPSQVENVNEGGVVLVGAGSSFTINEQGHLLTNQHVVDGCQIVTIHLPSGLKKALVVATDDTNDLALLKTDLEDDNFIPISGTNVSLLEDVIVAGYPLSGSLSTTVKVTKGVVSSLAGLGNDYSQIQIDAAIQPGNSGGPILNDQGNVVAVTVAALNKEYFLKEQGTIPENTNFGIKSSTARAFVDANGVKLPQPYSRAMSRRDMADLITKTTHLVGCWVSHATAQKMASDQKQELSVTPTMQRQVDALR